MPAPYLAPSHYKRGAVIESGQYLWETERIICRGERSTVTAVRYCEMVPTWYIL